MRENPPPLFQGLIDLLKDQNRSYFGRKELLLRFREFIDLLKDRNRSYFGRKELLLHFREFIDLHRRRPTLELKHLGFVDAVLYVGICPIVWVWITWDFFTWHTRHHGPILNENDLYKFFIFRLVDYLYGFLIFTALVYYVNKRYGNTSTVYEVARSLAPLWGILIATSELAPDFLLWYLLNFNIFAFISYSALLTTANRPPIMVVLQILRLTTPRSDGILSDWNYSLDRVAWDVARLWGALYVVPVVLLVGPRLPGFFTKFFLGSLFLTRNQFMALVFIVLMIGRIVAKVFSYDRFNQLGIVLPLFCAWIIYPFMFGDMWSHEAVAWDMFNIPLSIVFMIFLILAKIDYYVPFNQLPFNQLKILLSFLCLIGAYLLFRHLPILLLQAYYR